MFSPTRKRGRNKWKRLIYIPLSFLLLLFLLYSLHKTHPFSLIQRLKPFFLCIYIIIIIIIVIREKRTNLFNLETKLFIITNKSKKKKVKQWKITTLKYFLLFFDVALIYLIIANLTWTFAPLQILSRPKKNNNNK